MKKIISKGKQLNRAEQQLTKGGGGGGGVTCYFVCQYPNGSKFKFDAQGTCDWLIDPCLQFGASSIDCRCF